MDLQVASHADALSTGMSKAMIDAWTQATQLVDETEFTPWAEEGWLAWNGQSPEMAVCGFVQSLIQMTQPKLIVETGVGQGYMTRAIVQVLTADQELVAYESDDDWRAAMWTLPFWTDNRFNTTLAEDPSPGLFVTAAADLCVFDSDWEWRFAEVKLWNRYAKPGSVAIIHDTNDEPDTIHRELRELILELGMTGVFLNNPRGCFMAVQPKEK